MIKKYVSLIALSLTLITCTSTTRIKAMEISTYCPNCVVENGEKNKEKCDTHIKSDIKMLSSAKSLSILSEDDKKELKEISTCLENGTELSKSQVKKIMKIKNKVLECVLGQDDYAEFKKLLKKDKDKCLTDDEKTKLHSYFDKIKEIK